MKTDFFFSPHGIVQNWSSVSVCITLSYFIGLLFSFKIFQVIPETEYEIELLRELRHLHTTYDWVSNDCKMATFCKKFIDVNIFSRRVDVCDLNCFCWKWKGLGQSSRRRKHFLEEVNIAGLKYRPSAWGNSEIRMQPNAPRKPYDNYSQSQHFMQNNNKRSFLFSYYKMYLLNDIIIYLFFHRVHIWFVICIYNV